MSSCLTIQAGNRARKRLLEEGFRADQFRYFIGASGGPKWFSLYGLDQYLAAEFFPQMTRPLITLGSSAGAWRMACHAQSDPGAALKRLARHYSQETYSSKPDRDEITQKAALLLDRTLGTEGARQIVTNPRFHTHVLTDRARGLTGSENTALQMTGLGLAALANLFSRKTLPWSFERCLLYSGSPNKIPLDSAATQQVPLTETNIHAALMASGAIPVVLAGVRRLPGAAPGCYRDGGIVDYHLDLPWHDRSDLVLYPHFYPHIVPGWFDKRLRWRRHHPEWFSNVVMLSPSKTFVANLPYGKIPDRKDFNNLTEADRIRYWQQVLDASFALADACNQLTRQPLRADRIEPL